MRKLIYKFTLYTKLFFRKLQGHAIPVISLSESDQDTSLFSKLYDEHGPVVIIKDFIPKHRISRIRQALETHRPESFEPDSFGYCYGQNLMTALDLDNYLAQEPGFTRYLKNIQLDYDQLIRERIQPQSLLPVERVQYEGKPYFPATIRFLQPGQGGIKPHTELLHYELFEPCRHIATMLNLDNEISAFCVLQKPDAGGKLRIFHCTYRETQQIAYEDLRYDFVKHSGYTDLDPEEGDLVLFGGGQRWHCITEIEGKTNRITIGNFFCFNKENSRVFYWS